MDAIKGTMTEIYNDLSKSTSGNTIAEVKVSLFMMYEYQVVQFVLTSSANILILLVRISDQAAED